MKTVTAQLKQHMAGPVTSLASCWIITRRDGQTFRFTDHDRDLSLDGVSAEVDGDYLSATGYTPSEISSSNDLKVDELEMQVLYSAVFDRGDILAGIWDGAEVRIFLVNWRDTSMGVLKLRRGHLGEFRLRGDMFTVELRGMLDVLQQTSGRVYAAACDADLGDSRCGVNLAPFTVAGTVTGVTDAGEFADSSRTEADDWFTFGLLTWTSGDNNGRSIEVADYSNADGGFVLALPMPDPIQVGDSYSVYAGCNKEFKAHCADKFSNGENHRGFPHLPQEDVAVRAYTADTTTTSRSSAK